MCEGDHGIFSQGINMSILDKSSLVMIPCGYKEDKLYSVKPRNGEGDFTFTRASTGTRVSSDGYIETAEVLSTTELITNGDFSNGSTDWNLPSGVTYNSNGYLDCNNVSSNINQTTSIASGETYKISFEIKNYVSGTYIRIRINGGVFNNVNINGNGVYTSIITADQSSVFRFYPTTLNGSLDNISVKELSQINVPRLDYTNSTTPTLLLEPQRTNLALGSENLSLTYWHTSAGSSMVNDTTISPDGTQNASTLTFGSSQGSQYEDYFAGSYGNQTHTVSCYVKVASGTSKFRFKCSHWGVADFYSDDYTATDEWQRFTFSKTFTASGGTGIIAGLKNETAGGSKDILVYGFQLEANASFPTSYIPTSGTSVTRVKDLCVATSVTDLIGQTEGVVNLKFQKEYTDTYRIFTLYGTNTSNRLGIFTINNNLYVFVVSGGVLQFQVVVKASMGNGTFNIAVQYKQNDYKIYVNGVSEYTNTSANVPVSLIDVLFAQLPNGALSFNHKIHYLYLFKETLTDTELEELTTI